MNSHLTLFVAILIAAFALSLARSEFAFPDRSVAAVQRRRSFSYATPLPISYPAPLSATHDASPPVSYERDVVDATPEGRNMHRAKKLKKKIRRLCRLTGGRGVRSVRAEGKFFFPTVIQQTDVSVNDGGDDFDHYDDDTGSETKIDCARLLSSGLLSPHPLLGVLGGGGSSGGGGDGDGDDGDNGDESKFHHWNLNRHVIRPLYKSMRKLYRLLK